MSSSQFGATLNLGNSVVGVSILTMPWCFSQCGIILGTLLLVLSALFTTWTCKMLLRAAHMTRQYTYETLGHAVYGSMGKLGIEISNIGLGIGTCVAFYVIIGDLLPPLVAQSLGIDWEPRVLRGVLLVISGLLIAFPLTLIRNVDKLSVISVGSLAFYLFFIVQLVFSSRSHMTWEELWSGVVWWRTKGVFQCLAISSLAFSCQSQMFVIYVSLREGNVRKMSSVVDGAVWMVCAAYLSVAMFGYLSYYTTEIKGDVLSNFPFNSLSQFTRFGFAVTVMLSFPLIVFPCRVSLNSLLFANDNLELHVNPPIPQGRFIAITAGVMFSTLALAILIPYIQTVLALVGATLGSLICFIFPGMFLTKVAGSNTEFSSRAKFCIGLGLCVFFLSTIVTLDSWSEEGTVEYHIKPIVDKPEVKLPADPLPPDNEPPALEQDPKPHNEDPPHEEAKPEVPLNQGNVNPVIDSPEDDVNKEHENGGEEGVNVPGKLEEGVNVPGKLEEGVNVHGELEEGVNVHGELEEGVNVHGKLQEGDNVHGKLEEGVNVHGKLEEGDNIHGKLEKLVERVEKLEEENKDLKERQAEMEKVKEAPDGQPLKIEEDVLHREEELEGVKSLEGAGKEAIRKTKDKALKREAEEVVERDEAHLEQDAPKSLSKNLPREVDPIALEKLPDMEGKVEKDVDVNQLAEDDPLDLVEKLGAVADPEAEMGVADREPRLEVGERKDELSGKKDVHLPGARDLKSA